MLLKMSISVNGGEKIAFIGICRNVIGKEIRIFKRGHSESPAANGNTDRIEIDNRIICIINQSSGACAVEGKHAVSKIVRNPHIGRRKRDIAYMLRYAGTCKRKIRVGALNSERFYAPLPCGGENGVKQQRAAKFKGVDNFKSADVGQIKIAGRHDMIGGQTESVHKRGGAAATFGMGGGDIINTVAVGKKSARDIGYTA